MAGRILVIDDVATNRIVMKVKLSEACYSVDLAGSAAQAHDAITANMPDLAIIDMDLRDPDGLTLCRALKSDPATNTVPIILMANGTNPDDVVAALDAGAEDLLRKPVKEVTLLARVRTILRVHEELADLRRNDDTVRAMGFAEEHTPFASAPPRSGTIAILGPRAAGSLQWRAAIERDLGRDVHLVQREMALLGALETTQDPTPDAFVIPIDSIHRNAGLRILSDLRARRGTRNAVAIIILSDIDEERAAIALDLGADDVLQGQFAPQELTRRLDLHLRRKAEINRMQTGMQAGLQAAMTDPLTGLANRRAALPRLDRILSRPVGGAPEEMPAVMMIDLDHFKSVNDRFGHIAGDLVLKGVAERLRRELRSDDIIARIGGEEFLVILPRTDRDGATDCAERLCRAIGDHPFDIGKGGVAIPVTTSVGLCVTSEMPGHLLSVEAVLKQADTALYAAKNHGRDQVWEATPSAA